MALAADVGTDGWGRRASRAFLNGSAALWFLAAAAGQLAFFYYIVLFYGPSTLSGNFAGWTRNHALLKGYVPGDLAGNLAFGAHALLAAYVSLGGVLQILPQIRARWPHFHRWNGRAFILTAMGLSLTGLYMVWVRGATVGSISSIAISGDGVLILAFAALAWATARKRDFASHRRWALRTWLVANGQWFFRVGIFGWILLNQGPVGLGDDLDGPVAIFLAFGCYLVPLVVLELYFRAQTASPKARAAMGAGLSIAALFIAVGTFGAWMMIWQPVLARL
ncbi:MAG: DUF2306 domain-containing protein [Proteobacteria bacterium]|nr:DUF2306 domain-containing protein [Pseudomonadota bacterium]